MDAFSSRPFHFQFVAPPEDLRDRINTFFVLHTDAGRIEEVMPAYSAQLFLFLRGSGAMRFEDGTQPAPARAFFNAPLLQAAPFSIDGPVCAAGASFTHLGWAALADLPVHLTHDQVLPPKYVVSSGHATRLESLAHTDPVNIAQIFDPLAELVREASTPLKPVHAQLIEATMAWLSSAFSPPLEDLYRRLPLSERQVQRLCKRFFGAPPAQVLKRFRAVRAAAMLAQDNLPDDARDEVLSAYFDQAHLIRDIRRYTGRTPRLLVDGPLVVDTLDPRGHGPTAKVLRESLAAE